MKTIEFTANSFGLRCEFCGVWNLAAFKAVGDTLPANTIASTATPSITLNQ